MNLLNTQKQLRLSLRNVELGFQPLLNLISKIIADGNLNPYEKQIENFCYQFVIQIVEYLFSSNDQPFEMQYNQETDFKLISFLYIQKIKSFISSSQSKNKAIQQLLIIVHNLKKENEQQEGFSQSSNSSSSSSSLNEAKQKIQISLADQSGTKSQINIDEKDLMIEKLQQKLASSQQYISKMTTGYLKDIQNLRDQIFRGKETEYYDVQYFDSSEVSDEQLQHQLNNRLQDLKLKYELRTNDLYKTIETLRNESKEQKIAILNLQNKTKQLDNAEFLIKKACSLIDNPYVFWKILQDLKGNSYWYEVFEKQRPSFGINYREVNQLLMSSKAYEREYQYYKATLDGKMIEFYERTSKSISYLEEALKKKDEVKLMMLKNIKESTEQEERFVKERKSAIELMKFQFEELEQQQSDYCKKYEFQIQVSQKYSQEFEYLSAQLADIDRFKIQQYLKIWRLIAKIKKNFLTRDNAWTMDEFKQQLKSVLVDTNMVDQIRMEMDNKINFLETKIKLFKDENIDLRFESATLKAEFENLVVKFQKLQGTQYNFFFIINVQHMDCVQLLLSQNKQLTIIKNQYANIYNCALFLKESLEPKLGQMKLEEDIIKNEIIKEDFQELIKKLDPRQIRIKKEIFELSEKESQLIGILKKEDKWTMTKVHNVNISLQDSYQNPENQLEEETLFAFDGILFKKKGQNQKEVQTLLTGKDLDILELKEQELIEIKKKVELNQRKLSINVKKKDETIFSNSRLEKVLSNENQDDKIIISTILEESNNQSEEKQSQITNSPILQNQKLAQQFRLYEDDKQKIQNTFQKKEPLFQFEKSTLDEILHLVTHYMSINKKYNILLDGNSYSDYPEQNHVHFLRAYQEFEQFKRRQFRKKLKTIENSFKIQKEIQTSKDNSNNSKQTQIAQTASNSQRAAFFYGRKVPAKSDQLSNESPTDFNRQTQIDNIYNQFKKIKKKVENESFQISIEKRQPFSHFWKKKNFKITQKSHTQPQSSPNANRTPFNEYVQNRNNRFFYSIISFRQRIFRTTFKQLESSIDIAQIQSSYRNNTSEQ